MACVLPSVEGVVGVFANAGSGSGGGSFPPLVRSILATPCGGSWDAASRCISFCGRHN